MKNRNIIIVENATIISNTKDQTEKPYNYSVEAVEHLEIDHFLLENEEANVTEHNDIIDTIIRKYTTHPSILKIKENVRVENKFELVELVR